jgi:hypothetical protein
MSRRLRPYATRGFRLGRLFGGVSLLSGRPFFGLRLGRFLGVSIGAIASGQGHRPPALPRHEPDEELRRATKALEAAQARYDAAVRAAARSVLNVMERTR